MCKHNRKQQVPVGKGEIILAAMDAGDNRLLKDKIKSVLKRVFKARWFRQDMGSILLSAVLFPNRMGFGFMINIEKSGKYPGATLNLIILALMIERC